MNVSGKLSKEVHYKKLNRDPSQEFNNKILKILKTAVNLEDIPEKEAAHTCLKKTPESPTSTLYQKSTRKITQDAP